MYETWPAYIQLVGGDHCQSSTVRFAVAKQTRHKFSLSKQGNILPDNWDAFSWQPIIKTNDLPACYFAPTSSTFFVPILIQKTSLLGRWEVCCPGLSKGYKQRHFLPRFLKILQGWDWISLAWHQRVFNHISGAFQGAFIQDPSQQAALTLGVVL